MSYRLKPGVHLALVWYPDGSLRYHYSGGGAPGDMGPIIPWLNEQQREQFLRENLVEEIADPEPSPSAAAIGGSEASVLETCVAALDSLDVAAGAGAPRCREELRKAGLHFGNGTIAFAVKRRKERLAAVPDSA